MERGIVKSRVAFVLRSSEIKPLFDRFVTTFVTSHFFLRIFLVPFVLPMPFNHFHTILRLFDVLPDFPFTASETMGDYYLKSWYKRLRKLAGN